MKTILRHRGIGGLLFAQSQVAFNDNATKLIVIGLVQLLLPEDHAQRLVSLIALLLVTPFVLFAPLSGWLADRFPRRHVLAASLWLQLAVMGLLMAAVSIHSLPLAIGGFFLLGLQSALMSPARRGMVKDLAGDSVGEIVGWMEMLCIAAILAGSLAGGKMIDDLSRLFGSPWTAALTSLVVLTISCAWALWAFRKVPAHAAGSERPFSYKEALGHIELLDTLRRDRGIWRAAWGDAMFYLAGGILMLTLNQAARHLHPDGHGAASLAGIMLALMGTGVAIGSVGAACINRHRIVMGLVPVGALGMAGAFLALAFLHPGSAAFHGTLFALGLCGGLYLVPLGAFLLNRAPAGERGKILAASSMLSSIAGMAGMAAVAIHWIASDVLEIGLFGQFVMLATGLLATAFFATGMLSQEMLRLAALLIARVHYPVKTVGMKNLPATGGALIVCNHVSYVDTLVLSLASPRPIRFLAYADFFQTPLLGTILRIAGAVPVSSTKAREAIVRASECVEAGDLVCIFPEGQLTRTGCLMELKSGFELIARRAGCPVIVAHLDGLWGSIFSFEGGRYFTKWPGSLRRKCTVSFSTPLNMEKATAPRVREHMLEMGEAAFRARSAQKDLAASLLHALSRKPSQRCLIDPSSETKEVRACELQAMAGLLGRRWRTALSERRVGVMLPPGLGGALANLALIYAGKIPVNLNPTLSAKAARHCLDQAGVRTVITSPIIEKKFPDFPWPVHVLSVEKEIKKIPAFRCAMAVIGCFILPAPVASWRMGLARKNVDDEALLLFTSGTSGLPKGVPLTHRNILSNLRQISETGFLRPDDRLLSALPLFHSFGLTMGLLFPLLARRVVVTSPSPLDNEKLTEAARQGVPTVLLSTPTFLRGYTRRISRDAFGTLRLIVTGAEKLPADIASAAMDRFGCEVFEGYGLTEASPVVSINMPNPPCGVGADSIQKGWHEGSTGRLLPGMAMRLLDPETGVYKPGLTRGLLALRGANIISAYLHGDQQDKLRDGWYVTGDIARIHHEGFLFLEGRLSRFSKIGGEMVSHIAVEQAISHAFPEEGQDCVMGRPSTEKGEELVLLTTRPLSREMLREKLDIPNLWIPRVIVHISKLPALGSGKLDLAACREIMAGQSADEPTIAQPNARAR